MHATFFLIILLLSTRACCDDHPHASKGSNCLESERRALLAIKSDLYNSDHWLSSWTGYDCCKWKGVACDNTTGHVNKLNLHSPVDPAVSFPNISKAYQCVAPQMEYHSFKDNIIITAKGLTNEYTNALSAVASIDLSNNDLSGEIPKEITKLHGLDFLNLSNNHLIGRIPENIGAIKELESLDLSMNYLMGEIPAELSALSYLESLNLSHNNLSGRIPTGGQLSTFNDSIYVGNEDLCGVPLPECPGDEANHSPYQAEDDDKLERVLDYAAIVMGFIVGFWAYLGEIFIQKTARITLFRMVDNMYDWMYVHLSLKFTKLKLKWQEKSLST